MMRLRVAIAIFVLISFFSVSYSFAANLDTKPKRVAGATWLRGVPCGFGYGPDPDANINNESDRNVMAGEYAPVASVASVEPNIKYWWWFQGN